MGDISMTKAKKVIIYSILTLAAVLIFFPVVFSLLLSFSTNVDITQGSYIPKSLDFSNYIRAFSTQPLLHYMKNSLVVASLSTVLQIILALLASYAVVFVNFKGREYVFMLFMATMMIPSEVLVISNFQTIREWGLMNTFAGLILPSLSGTFGIFLLRQNLKQIPYELKEASQIAGVGDFYFFRRAVIPMVKNTIITLAIYNFLVSWNSYLWPLLSTTTDAARTVQIGLRQLKNVEALSDFGMMSAGAMLVSLPTLILIFIGQKRLQEGLTKGALK